MLIDVIIPSFNRADLLIRAIQSVLKQNYQNFNLYVVDDGSTDDTSLKMLPFLCHPKVHLLTQQNKGVSAARNYGIRSSQSAWISFLDSDDEWLPHKLEGQVQFISHHPQFRFVHSNEIWIRNGVRVNPKAKFDKSNESIFKRSLETCLISPSTVLMKRELCEEHGLFDENFQICEDYDLWLKILATEEVGFISDNLITKYGGHSDQLSTKYPGMDFWRIRSMANLFRKSALSQEKKELILLAINRKAPLLLSGHLKHGNHDQYQKLLEMLKYLPGW